MQYIALATDYDGTLAHHGHVDEETLESCRRLRESGRKLLLVTGRELPELQKTFPDYEICDLIVAENGALLYDPATGSEELLAEPPPPEFAAEMQARRLTPCSFGRVIIATWQPHEAPVLEIIRQLGLEYQIIFNKGAVMVLPSGVNKATGLAHALLRFGLTAEQVVGIGDAENDHAFLDACAVAVAVDNALGALKEHCDLVTSGDHGRGVQELIARLLADDLQSLGARRPRRAVSALPQGETQDSPA
jgi:hydroxymethylpyrimidine pyrophosphatase-like HAD family hydrolase